MFVGNKGFGFKTEAFLFMHHSPNKTTVIKDNFGYLPTSDKSPNDTAEFKTKTGLSKDNPVLIPYVSQYTSTWPISVLDYYS